MASVKTIKNADGSKVFGAQVRIKGFDAVYRSFPTRDECIAWRDALTRELKKQRQQGNVRPDLPGLTVAALNKSYLADPATVNDHAIRYVDGLKRWLAWWDLHYGTCKVMEFGVLSSGRRVTHSWVALFEAARRDHQPLWSTEWRLSVRPGAGGNSDNSAGRRKVS